MSDSITLSNAAHVYFNTSTGQPYPGAPVSDYQYDYVVAGTGDDTVDTGYGSVTVVGSSGVLHFNDTSEIGTIFDSGEDTVSGGTGTLIAQSGYYGGLFTGGSAGNNVFVANDIYGSSTTMNGAATGDEFFGSMGSSVGGGFAAGNDIMNLGAGRETVVEGDGPTTVNGGTGNAAIFAGSGTSYFYGGSAGNSSIIGGSGTVNVLATQGDAVFGGSGNAFVIGSTSGADSIIGGTGSLGVQGRGGNMLVSGGTGDNKVETGNGAALVFAGAGNMTLTGGTGSLQMVVGSGSAAITEGSGSALYDVVQGDAGGATMITGFKVGTDKIDLFGYTASEITTASSGGSSVISLSNGAPGHFAQITTITLAGVASIGGGVFS